MGFCESLLAEPHIALVVKSELEVDEGLLRARPREVEQEAQ